MKKVLGLDIGTNSIGWALIEDGKRIIDIGVRIFPEGVNRDKLGNEISKNAERRLKRQSRRLFYRRRMRKTRLAHQLMEAEMFPKVENLETELSKTILRNELKEFFAINPYACRARAYRGEQLTLFELGRVLYQFSQRRGYKSNLQSDDSEESVIYSGKPEEDKIGINEMEQKAKEYGTIGNYLASLDPHKQRIRNRYTTRGMYIDEFNVIWDKQSNYYPHVLTEALKKEIGDATDGILFFQRPLRSQKDLLGKCTFEKGKRRCPISSPVFERFRMMQFINSIRNGETPLNAEQRAIVEELFYSKDKLEFGAIKKKLHVGYSNFNYDDELKLPVSKTTVGLRKIFGKDRWDKFTDQQKDEIWHVKFDATDKDWLINYAKEKWELDDKQATSLCKLRLDKGYASLSKKAIENILYYLEKGFIYSDAVLLAGIRKAFPKQRWEELGADQKELIETNAIEIANNVEGKSVDNIRKWLKEDFGLDEKAVAKLYHHSDISTRDGQLDFLDSPQNMRNPIVQQALHELRKLVNAIIKEHGKPDQIRVELARDMKSSKKDREKKQYEMRMNEKENTELKKTLDEYNRPHTRGFIQKLKLFREIEKRAKAVSCPYTGKGIGITDVLRNDGYVQIEHIVPYSRSLDDSMGNKTLCIADENREKSNKTPFEFYADSKEHWDEIKKRAFSLLPYPKYVKFISDKPAVLDDFISRQLNDTRYISRSAREYLKGVCVDVAITQGGVTSMLRHYWGLDNILQPPMRMNQVADGEYIIALDKENKLVEIVKWNAAKYKDDIKRLEKVGRVVEGNIKEGTLYLFKSREDHRHHAIDALTVACAKTTYLQVISKMKGRGTQEERILELQNFPLPWNSFFMDARERIGEIMVSHKNRIRTLSNTTKHIKKNGEKFKSKGIAARGQLHDATVYGEHTDQFGVSYFHIRKPLSEITKKAQVDKIADKVIHKLVEEAIVRANPSVDLTKKYDVPPNAFFTKDEHGKNVPQVYLPNKNGEPVPIKKVRLRESSSNAFPLKDNINQWVEPGNNHHILIYETHDGEWQEQVVSFREVVERKKQKTPIVRLPENGKRIIATMQANDIFVIGISPSEAKHSLNDPSVTAGKLFRVQKISSFYYTFRKITAANLDNPNDMIAIRSFKAWRELNPIKIKITETGKLIPLSHG